jgi:sugar lactone lactonase YvrE
MKVKWTKSIPFFTGISLLCTTQARADDIYISSGNSILKFNSNGAMSHFANVSLGFPNGLAFDSSGNLYSGNLSSSADTIEKFDPAGLGSIFVSSGLNGHALDPQGLAFDKAGNLYVANNGFNTVSKFNSSGAGSIFVPSVNDPYGIAFDRSGNLYVATGVYGTVMKFDSSGVGSVFAATGLTDPVGLAFDSGGNLYVADGLANRIMKFNPAGVGSVFATAGLDSPRSLAFDSSGNLFVVNASINHTTSNTIMEFNPSGAGSVFASGLVFPEGIAIIPEPSACVLLATAAGMLLAIGFKSRLVSIASRA